MFVKLEIFITIFLILFILLASILLWLHNLDKNNKINFYLIQKDSFLYNSYDEELINNRLSKFVYDVNNE